MMDFHKGRWRLALGRLVNLRYINRWIIFSADLFVSLSVSLLGVLGGTEKRSLTISSGVIFGSFQA